MSVADAWAQIVWTIWKSKLALGDPHPLAFDRDPSETVRSLTRNLLLCAGPTEFFSTEMPTWSPPPADEDLRPIDILYGSYDAVTRSIRIFINRIWQDAAMLGATPSELTHIVRVHEYGHAVVHLGVPALHACDPLSKIGSDHLTDWAEHVERRTEWFRRASSELHEFLVQAITYGVLAKDPEAERLCRIFELLEERQPAQYRLPAGVKSAAVTADWALVLEAARENLGEELPDGFDIIAGLHAILTGENPRGEWVAPLSDTAAIEHLQGLLQQAASSDNASPNRTGADGFSILVARFNGLKIEVFAREHGPPHFRVACAGETANFRIKDCEQLNGGLQRYRRVIREWHEGNKQQLIDCWNNTRLSDCPVGPYRES